MQRVTVITIVLFLAGCEGKEEPLPVFDSAQSFVDYYYSIDTNVEIKDRRDFRQLLSVVWQRTNEPIKRIDSPELLRSVFYECQKHEEKYREQSWSLQINPFEDAQYMIFDRLADINSDESARVLVGLYKDADLPFDAHYAEMLLQNITRVGKKALPYLEEVDDDFRPWATRPLIEDIEAGKTLGP